MLYGPVGTGKTHLAVVLGRLACMRAIPAGFFTATGLLMRLRRAKREDRLDAELRQIARARLLPQRARPHDQITKEKRGGGFRRCSFRWKPAAYAAEK